MKTACAEWKDALLEATLTGTMAGELEDHLKMCVGCAEAFAALQVRRERIDTLLPLMARGEEPSPEFRARLLARADALRKTRRVSRWRTWALAGVAAAIAAAAIVSLLRQSREPATPDRELVAAQSLAEWRAPSDVLLETPGRELLRATPRLGESYVKIPVQVDKEN